MDWFRHRRERGRPRHPDILTPAEWRVLEHVREGATNAETAVRLGVSINTVRYHVSSMLAKLELRDRRELAAWDGEPVEASRVALERATTGRSALAAPFAWLREAWVGKVAVGASVVAVSVLAVLVMSQLQGTNEGGGASTPTPIATEVPEVTPTVPAVADPNVDLGPPAGVWLVDIETEHVTVLHEGDRYGGSHFDPGGETATVQVRQGDWQWDITRVDLNGQVLEEHDDRLLLHQSPDGASQSYLSVAPEDLPGGRLVVEREGEEVELAEVATHSAGFSPDSALMLAGVVLPPDGDHVRLYRVYSLETGAVLFSFETRWWDGTDTFEHPRWSPSGRFIAARNIEGLTVHDIETGEAHFIGDGSPSWSPDEDAILALDEDGNLDLVRFPEGERDRLADGTAPATWAFSTGGGHAYGISWEHSETVVIDLADGSAVATWDTALDTFPGAWPLHSTPTGPAAPLPAHNSCVGIRLIHPDLQNGEECLEGHTARWSPDHRSIAYINGPDVLIFDIDTATARVVASGPRRDAAVARWNEAGTHLLVQWGWGGVGWEE